MQLSVRSLNVKRGGKSLLTDVSLEFSTGKLHYLIGLNGSGKTTLLKCLAGAIPSSSSVLLTENPLADMPARERARHIAWVPQHLVPYAQYTTREYVLMGRFPYLGILGSYQEKDRELADFYLDHLALGDFAERVLNTLSGGELQRASLARALVQETPILLLDEPDQSLDPPAREDLFNRLHLLSEAGKTIICTTHHLEALENTTARVIGIRAGKIVWDAPGGKHGAQLRDKVYGRPAS